MTRENQPDQPPNLLQKNNLGTAHIRPNPLAKTRAVIGTTPYPYRDGPRIAHTCTPTPPPHTARAKTECIEPTPPETPWPTDISRSSCYCDHPYLLANSASNQAAAFPITHEPTPPPSPHDTTTPTRHARLRSTTPSAHPHQAQAQPQPTSPTTSPHA